MDRLQQTLEWLYGLESRGEIYKLERMEAALRLLGDPHRRLQVVHIAGTKGKGSVAAMVDSCLRAAGYRCGLYTKPHLVNLAERTRINGAQIPAAVLLDYIETLRALYERAGMALTFFEFTVALMFLYFAQAKVDVAVIETGLGGRLDSTNVVSPVLSVITPIGFDHMEYLGYTIASIAGEKGGIIKPGVPVVIGTRDPEARQTLTAIAAQRRSAAMLVERDFDYRSYPRAHRLDYHGLGLELAQVELGLAGQFQQENAAIALAALEILRGMGWALEEAAIRRGLAEVDWPGRFDTVSRRPLVVLDCAHNELSIAALLRTVHEEIGQQPRPRLLFGCLADKQWAQMARQLAPWVSDVTLTRVKPKRPLDPHRLTEHFAPVPTRVIEEPATAMARLMAEATPQDFILVTGSVYLIGDVYPYFLAASGRRGLFPEAPC
ncbi:MAG TPA: folylpolyglutamate synthase/dihydrofolate synthase family protein [Candidatus Binataceae bacterium]|nr:folylpolyglutamate synthase/dihydrofolate synthase family protein [Candidatus Binataceae bacterium]